MMAGRRCLSSPIGGGGPRNAVEGASLIPSNRRQAPSTPLRVVPLPRWGRTKTVEPEIRTR